MKYLIISAVFILVLTAASTILFAQKVNFDRITTEDGLTQNNINCILQDKQGFLWFGTNGGLHKFDGLNFRVFQRDAADTTSITGNIIHDLLEDPSGNLWIATQNGLSYYDKGREIFYNYHHDDADSTTLSNNVVTSLAQDPDGTLWIGTMGGGINKLNPESRTFIKISVVPGDSSSLASDNITSIIIDKSGLLWAGTSDAGLNIFNPVTNSILRYQGNPEGPDDFSLTSSQILNIYEDKTGKIWIGTDNGINMITPTQSGSRQPVSKFLYRPKTNATAKYSIQCITQGNNDIIWIGSKGRGLGKLNLLTGKTSFYSTEPANPHSLNSNNVTSLFYGRAGILWIGTNAGINYIDHYSDRFALHQRKPGAQNTLSSNNVQAILKEPNGTVWIGTYDRGLNRYDPLTHIYTTFLANDVLVEGESLRQRARILKKYNKKVSDELRIKLQYLSNNRVLSLYKDPNRRYLWIGTGGGLNKMNLTNGRIFHYLSHPDDPSSLSSNVIYTILPDHGNQLWIGTGDGGLNHFNGKTFRSYKYDAGNSNSISNNDIRCITKDTEGHLWIGTFGGGLNQFNPDTGVFSHYQQQEDNTGGISSNTIYSLLFTDSTRLWIGTDNGLNLLDLSDHSFTVYTIRHGLPSNVIYSIISDGMGNLWISTNKGISRFNIAKAEFRNYGLKDGLQGNEFNPGSGFKTRRGEILFGGFNGYNSFYPDRMEDNIYIPEIVITEFRILNEKILPGEPGSPLKKPIYDTDTLVLSHLQNTFSFEFVALNYTNAESNEYAYKLENFDEKWNEVKNRRFANYTNVPPGQYTFKVIGSNNDGYWNYDGRSVYIIITPPFWQTWLFYALVILLIIILIYSIIYLRTRRLQRMKAVLEKLVKSRTLQMQQEKALVEKAHGEILIQKNKIERQHNLLKKKNEEITLAKSELDNVNEELKNINANLENIVRERTNKLQVVNRQLSQANDELDKFIYRASHDLKGPIARLLGLSMIAKMDKSEHNIDDYIDLMQSNAFNMNRVINKLTNVHHINKRKKEFRKIDLPIFVHEIKQKLSKHFDIKTLDIRISQARGVELYTDPVLLLIILENLIENAILFRRKMKALVELNLQTDDDQYILSVKDDGIGIPKEQHSKIFDMFFRASEKSYGNGLGLYLVNKAVKKLHGNIRIESTENEFTIFTISFPRELVDQDQNQTLLNG